MSDTTAVLAVDWGPVGVWAGAIATALAVIVALLSSLGLFNRYRRARLVITFQPRQPWCRLVEPPNGGTILWARVGIENHGATTARGCVGRLVAVTTNGITRTDIDPLQLRWAGVPRSTSFEPIDIRPGQREYLNVLYLQQGQPRWSIDTFATEDFQPGFTTQLDINQPHRVRIALFADNTDTIEQELPVDVGADRSFDQANRSQDTP